MSAAPSAGGIRQWLSSRRLFLSPDKRSGLGWVLCAAATAIVLVGTAFLLQPGEGWHRLPVLIFALAVPLLMWVDLVEHRLPDLVVLPLLIAVASSTVLAAVVESDGDRLGQAVLGALLLGAAFALLFVIAPASLGFGDVKLALVIGMLVGWYGWRTAFITLFLTFVLGLVHGLIAAMLQRRLRGVHIAFGPAMLAAGLMTCVAAGTGL